jgi:hypothetical protein
MTRRTSDALIQSAATIAVAILPLLLTQIGYTQELSLHLQQDVTSKMPNGAPFSAIDAEGHVHSGYVASKKAKWFHGLWNRGTVRLVFDEPLEVMSVGGRDVKQNGEAPAKIGNRVQQAAEVGLAYVVAKTADDLYFDKPYGPVGGQAKAIPIDVGIGMFTAFVLPGPNAKLKAGTIIEAEVTRPDSPPRRR